MKKGKGAAAPPYDATMNCLPPPSGGNPKTLLGFMGDAVVFLIAMAVAFLSHIALVFAGYVMHNICEGSRQPSDLEYRWAYGILLGCSGLSLLLGGYDVVFGPGFVRRPAKVLATAWLALFTGYFFSMLPDIAIKFILGAGAALILVGWFSLRKTGVRAARELPAATLSAKDPSGDPMDKSEDNTRRGSE